MNYIKKISKDWVLTVLLFVTMATVAFTSTVMVRTSNEAKHISENNQTFLINFSSFMQCLVVSDHEVVETLGVQAYFDECNKLLFLGTGQTPVPITKVTIPTTTTTTTTEPTTATS